MKIVPSGSSGDRANKNKERESLIQRHRTFPKDNDLNERRDNASPVVPKIDQNRKKGPQSKGTAEYPCGLGPAEDVRNQDLVRTRADGQKLRKSMDNSVHDGLKSCHRFRSLSA